MTTQEIDRTTFERQWRDWHEAHERQRADAHGFLAITSIRWLGPVPERFDDAPGEWSADERGVAVTLAEGEELRLDGEVIRGHHEFGVLAERTDVKPGFGDAVIEIAKRGGHHILRPRHPGHDLRTRYQGTPAFAPDPAWVLAGRFQPFDRPRPTTVGAVAEGIEHVYESPGVLEFDVHGQTHRLTAFNGKNPGSLMVLFTDATSGVTTYAANRQVGVAAPGADGSVTIDFNRAVNLPCAYTDFATCPLPPTENHLPFAVEAGELIPRERQDESR